MRYARTFPAEVIVRRHPTDEDVVLVRSTFGAGELQTETLVCEGRSFPFVGSTFLGAWAAMAAQEHAVPIDGSTDVSSPVPGGTSKTTIFIKKASS